MLLQAIFLLIQKFHFQVILHKSVMLLTHIPACDRIPHGSFSVKLWVTLFLPVLRLQRGLFQLHVEPSTFKEFASSF